MHLTLLKLHRHRAVCSFEAVLRMLTRQQCFGQCSVGRRGTPFATSGALPHHARGAPVLGHQHAHRAGCSKRQLHQQLVRASAAGTAAASPQPEGKAVSTSSGPAAYTTHKWMWRGHKINYITAGCGDPVVLIHGFGLSASHYRRMIKELAKDYKVYAIDLLGFGGSAKPVQQYTMELWESQVRDFLAEFTAGKPATLVGNSIGGLAALMVAADSPADVVRGVVLLNSAGAMNNKGLMGDWRIMLVYPLLLLIDFLLSIPSVATALFNSLRNKDNIRQALQNVYMNKASVDEELVEAVYGPSCDEGAQQVFVSVITGPPGPSPMGLMPRISCPLLVLWGDKDTLTPADGPVGKFFQALPATRANTTFKFLPDVGHLLHDDRPELVHDEIVPWLKELHSPDPARPVSSSTVVAEAS